MSGSDGGRNTREAEEAPKATTTTAVVAGVRFLHDQLHPSDCLPGPHTAPPSLPTPQGTRVDKSGYRSSSTQERNPHRGSFGDRNWVQSRSRCPAGGNRYAQGWKLGFISCRRQTMKNRCQRCLVVCNVWKQCSIFFSPSFPRLGAKVRVEGRSVCLLWALAPRHVTWPAGHGVIDCTAEV